MARARVMEVAKLNASRKSQGAISPTTLDRGSYLKCDKSYGARDLRTSAMRVIRTYSTDPYGRRTLQTSLPSKEYLRSHSVQFFKWASYTAQWFGSGGTDHVIRSLLLRTLSVHAANSERDGQKRYTEPFLLSLSPTALASTKSREG